MIDVYNMTIIIVFLFLLQIKHLIADFYMQTPEMVKGKAIFGNADGILHSLYHAIGTYVICQILAIE